jgi:TonB family protein
MNSRAFACIICIASFLLPGLLQAQGPSASLVSPGTSAVDMKGVRHYSKDYPRQHPPWLDDEIRAIPPSYPYADRAKHHEGVGWFRLILNSKTGNVTNVTVMKSTGFPTLDNAAMSAFRLWRWKAGKWKEIQVPVIFQMRSGPPQLPPGAVPLSR